MSRIQCEICGQMKTQQEMSKSYKHRCKKCVADMTRAQRHAEKQKQEAQENVPNTYDPAPSYVVGTKPDLPEISDKEFEHQHDDTAQKSADVNSNRSLSQETADCDKQFDNIIKDGFSKERRLNIAVQFMSAMMSNPAIFHQHLNAEEEDYILYGSLEFADALIAECENGGEK